MNSHPLIPRFRRLHRATRRAFTFLEVLIVLAILGLLVGLALNGVGKDLGKAKIVYTKTFVNTGFKTPLAAYRKDMGGYPTTSEGLQALLKAPMGKEGKWQGPYLDVPGNKLPLDPWKQPYIYRYPGTHNKDGYDLFSSGPDKIAGTADDIGNW